jgi:hypothetical protein
MTASPRPQELRTTYPHSYVTTITTAIGSAGTLHPSPMFFTYRNQQHTFVDSATTPIVIACKADTHLTPHPATHYQANLTSTTLFTTIVKADMYTAIPQSRNADNTHNANNSGSKEGKSLRHGRA